MKIDLSKFQIDMKKFYILGVICFTIINLCTIANFFIYFGNTNIFSKIATVFNIIFYGVLAGLFYHLYSTTYGHTPKASSSIEFEEAFKELNGK